MTELVKIVPGVSKSVGGLLVRGPRGFRRKAHFAFAGWVMEIPEVCQRIKEVHLCFFRVLNGYVDLPPWFGLVVMPVLPSWKLFCNVQ